MKIIIYFIIATSFVSCGDNSIETLTLVQSKKQFSDIFDLADSVILKPKDFDIPVSFTITKNKKFLLCDYIKKKVQLLDSTGSFIKDILRDTIEGKVFGSPICIAINSDIGKTFVADNSNRRIYILDSNFNYLNSFLISGSHMTPVFMQSYGNKLLMSGHNINNDKYIHLYTTEGIYQNSIYKSISPNRKNTYVNGASNYVKFDVMNAETYAIEIMNFGITKIDSILKTTTSYNFNAEYFRPLTKEKLNSIKQNFEEIKNSFSKPTYIKCFDEKVFVFSELPSISDFENFFNTRQYNLDVFSNSLSPILNGVDIGHMLPIGYYEQGKSFAFITNHDKPKSTYTIKFYKFKL
jgi:hypothetical protein